MSLNGMLPLDRGLRQQAQAHLQAQDWALAHECLSVLAALTPHDAWVRQWQVVVAMGLQRPTDAVAAALAALQVLPPEAAAQRADVAYNLGQAYGVLGRPVQALDAFDQALGCQPGHAAATLGRAKALAQLAEHGQAGRAATQALSGQLDPTQKLEALALVANSLVKAQAPVQALDKFLQYERLKPASPFIACMVVFLMRQLADWRMPALPVNAPEGQALAAAAQRGERPDLTLLALRARQNMPALEPFAGLVLYDDPALQRHAAEQWLTRMHPPVPSVPAAARQPGPLRVAYVSCEFNEHATSYLLAGVLARHRRERVQVFLLSFAPPKADGPDAMQQRITSMGHTWVDIHRWSDAQVAQWCREQGMNVAVDLKGLTRDNRMGIFAHRAAPVQVNWLGYPGSLPAPYFDWVLADVQVLPPELEPHFAERVWRLPHSYQPNDPDRPIDPTPQRRSDHGLPESGPVLVCFNNSFKITPEVWAVWMRLLQARSDAVLWLLAGQETMQHNLRAHAQAAGVDPQRLVFAPQLPQAQHLARLQLAELSLDTLPYNAHTTASDALWAGVPHVACTGQSFAARVGASVLMAAGMPELIAQGLAEYEALAMRLLTDDAERQRLRERLSHQHATASLWDAHAFVQDLEEAWIGMFKSLTQNQ